MGVNGLFDCFLNADGRRGWGARLVYFLGISISLFWFSEMLLFTLKAVLKSRGHFINSVQ